MDAILFYSLAVLTVGLSLLVILQPNAIGAAMSLVGAFFGIAALFALLEAHFVAIMQILLYAGAIMVFFIFVIMLLNLEPAQLRWRTLTGGRLIGAGIACLLLALLLVVTLDAVHVSPAVVDLGLAARGARGTWGTGGADPDPPIGTTEAVGELLLSHYVVPFEVTSVLLLVGMIGAVVMGKKSV